MATVSEELRELYSRRMGRAGKVLWDAFRHHYHKDKSNAATHCTSTRFSPLTIELARVLKDNEVLEMHPPEHRDAVQEVLAQQAAHSNVAIGVDWGKG